MRAGVLALLAAGFFLPGSGLAQTNAPLTLGGYLTLTPAQTAAIVAANRTYNDSWDAGLGRRSTIESQVRQQLAQQQGDPQQIGAQIVELEQIRRDLAAKQIALQSQVAALLTPAQKLLIENLKAAAILQPLADAATCAYLVRPAALQWFDSSIYSSGTQQFYYDFIASGLPYVPPAPTGLFCGSQTFPISVRQYLALTDDQVAQLYSASADYNDFSLRQQNRLADLNQQVTTLRASGTADPLALGLAYAEIASIGQQMKARSNQLRDAALTRLTPDQSAKIAILQSVRDFSDQRIFDNAQGCNLLVLPAGTGAGSGPATGAYAFCPL